MSENSIRPVDRTSINTPSVSLRLSSQQASHRARLENSISLLNAVSPLNTLARGYSITTDDQGRALIDSKQLKIKDKIHTRLNKGSVISSIEKIEDN